MKTFQVLISPGCPRPNSAFIVQKSGLKHQHFILNRFQVKVKAVVRSPIIYMNVLSGLYNFTPLVIRPLSILHQHCYASFLSFTCPWGAYLCLMQPIKGANTRSTYYNSLPYHRYLLTTEWAGMVTSPAGTRTHVTRVR